MTHSPAGGDPTAAPSRPTTEPSRRGPLSPTLRATLAYVAAFTAIGAAFPYLPIHYRALGLDLATIGALSALWAAVSLVGSPAWGALTDRFPRSRLVLPTAAMLAALAAAGLALAHGLPEVVVAVVCLAAAGSGVTPMLDARTLDLLGDDRHLYGRLRAWGSIAFIMTAALVGFLIERLGTRSLFLVYAPAFAITALIALWLPRSRRPATTGRLWAGATKVVRAPGMRLFLIGSFLTWTAVISVNSFLSVQLVTLGAPAELVGAAWAIGAMVEVPIMFAFPRLAARFGTHRLLLAGAVAFVLRASAYALVGSPELLVAATTLEGAGFGLFFVGSVGFVAELAPPGLIATAQGVHSAVTFGLASITGAALGGVIASTLTIPGLFAVAAAASAGAVVVVGVALRAASASVARAVEIDRAGSGA